VERPDTRGRETAVVVELPAVEVIGSILTSVGSGIPARGRSSAATTSAPGGRVCWATPSCHMLWYLHLCADAGS
jgi:hypothetical protein